MGFMYAAIDKFSSAAAHERGERMRYRTARILLAWLVGGLSPRNAHADDAADAGEPSVETKAPPTAAEVAAAPAPPPIAEPAPEEAATELPNETPIEYALAPDSAMMFRSIGGYGEVTLNVPEHAPAIADLRRFVLYVGHHFTESLRFYSEVEVEHAVTSNVDEGAIEMLQAYVDALFTRAFNLRLGLVLLPVGSTNIYHEPTTYNGVEPPDVDSFIVPDEWREAAVSCFGELARGLRYQVVGATGLDATKFTAQGALAEAPQGASLANADDLGAAGRIDWEPIHRTVVGAAGYAGTSANSLRAAIGGRVPVTLAEVDARTHIGGFSARAEAAVVFIGDAAALNRALSSVGTPSQQAAVPVASQAQGAYVEAGYDVLHLLARRSEQQLTAFGRFDYVDTQAKVPAGFVAHPEFRRYTTTLGLTYKPIPYLAFKLDYRRHEFGAGAGFNEAVSAIAWLF
jgi:hypothetical protein